MVGNAGEWYYGSMKMSERVLKWADSFVRLPIGGLDICDRSAKCIVFRPRDGLRLQSFGELEIPEGMIEQGEIKKENDLAQLFQQWFAGEQKAIRSFFFAVSLPEEKSFLRLIQLPKMKREKVGNAIRWEIEANIPLKSEDLIYDYEIVEPLGHDDHFDVVLTAFPKLIVESYLRVLKQAGIQCAALELESQAVMRSVIPSLHEVCARVVIDIGRTRTSLIVFSAGAIIFTTTMELGGALFEQSIEKELHVSKEEAARFKKEVGLDRSVLGGDVFGALTPSVSALAGEVRRAIGFYQDRSKHTNAPLLPISSILLVGGDANLSGLDTYLSATLRIPVMRANPFVAIHERLNWHVPPIQKNKSLGFTTAIGLALRGIR